MSHGGLQPAGGSDPRCGAAPCRAALLLARLGRCCQIRRPAPLGCPFRHTQGHRKAGAVEVVPDSPADYSPGVRAKDGEGLPMTSPRFDAGCAGFDGRLLEAPLPEATTVENSAELAIMPEHTLMAATYAAKVA